MCMYHALQSSVSHNSTAQDEFLIPTERTWYENTCLTASELPDLGEVGGALIFAHDIVAGCCARAR